MEVLLMNKRKVTVTLQNTQASIVPQICRGTFRSRIPKTSCLTASQYFRLCSTFQKADPSPLRFQYADKYEGCCPPAKVPCSSTGRWPSVIHYPTLSK